jgi:hypothetical protein
MNKWTSIVTALALCVGMSGTALAQDRGQHRGRDDRDGHFRQNEHRDRDDQRGRWSWHRDRDHDRDRDHFRFRYYNGYYPNYGRGLYGYRYYGSTVYANQAAQIGYRDGVNDGRNDAATGHSFRPTYDRNYRIATDGFSVLFGDWGAYQQQYRLAYLQGYQAGYGQYGYGE